MRTGFRIGVWVGGGVLVLVGACALLAFAFFHKFYPAAPAARYPPAHDLATAQRQDLDYFKRYFGLNRSYSPASLAEAKAVWRDTEGKAGALSPAQFDLAIMRMVALADAGHSQIYKPSLYATANRIPCRFYRFADGWYVVRAGPPCHALLGGKLLTLDGQPAATLADRMYAYSLGPRNHYDQYVSPFYLESPDLLHAAGLTPTTNGLTVAVRMRDGTSRQATIAADPPDPQAVKAGSDWTDAYSDAYLAPQRIAGEPADWATLLPRDAQMPLFLRDYGNPFHSTWWPETRTLYVQFRSNEDEPGHPIRPFIAHVEQAIKTDQPRFIVLDLRLDQGGNFTTTAGLMQHITTLSGSIGHVYVLTSAWTFSAGNISLALVKEHGGGKVTTIGEPVGDHLRIWAEGRGMQLPNSKLWAHYATGYEDYSKPCWGHRDCFWVMLFYPTHVQSFDPDVRVAYTFDDYLHGRDPLLDKALELAAKARL
ncbi:MAG: hypothetical protein JSR56_01395 [Proteobacteria bacterium]|nr:hypothetical protein [Pseudomonadota bacterium]